MLASCLCLTMASRAAFLPRAVECFRSQDWPEKELILVADSDCDLSGVWDGRAVMVQPGLTIGEKRNLGVRLACGKYIVHFDDDDWSAPSRVSDQVNRLEESQRMVTSYRNLRFSDGKQTWITRNWPGGYGSTLAYRRDWWLASPFPNMQIDEDWEFVAAAIRAGRYIAGAAGEQMLCSIHPGNTAPVQIGANWELVNA